MYSMALCLLRCLSFPCFSSSSSLLLAHSLSLSLSLVNNEQTLWKQMLPLHQPLQRDPLEKISLFKKGKRDGRAASKWRLTDVKNGQTVAVWQKQYLWLSTMNDNDIRHGPMKIPNLTLEKPSSCAFFWTTSARPPCWWNRNKMINLVI